VWQFLEAVAARDLGVGVLLCTVLLQAFWILHLYRRTSCLLELLIRSNERVISASNETSKLHLQSYAAGARPLLSDLAHEHVEDWELTFSEETDE
jgi:hypothetical protein